MDKQQAKIRIEKLKKEVNHHRYLYHVLDKPEISDSALDSLKNELFKLEQQYPEFITSDSPTQRVGGEALKEFKKVKHDVRMLSFNDAFSKVDMHDWQKRMENYLKEKKEFNFYCEPKIDGLAISLIYKNGQFILGSTRGNGFIGEDVTINLKTIESIPLNLEKKDHKIYLKNYNSTELKKVDQLLEKFNLNSSELEVRGEIYLDKNDFEKLNKEQEKNHLQIFANPRNVAAGSIRQLNPKITASRKLKCFVYHVITDLGQTTHEQEHLMLNRLGFRINPYTELANNMEEVFTYHEKIGKIRNRLEYEIDGVVAIINDNKLWQKLGIVGKAPRGCMAYKFPGREATTIVEDIKVQVGRTGALTPVAHLKPVPLGGVTISHATLHNMDEIKRLGIKIGDTVIIQRAGDVIPDVVKVLTNLRTGKEKEFHMPSKCPICGSKVFRKKEEVAYYCSNKNCFALQERAITHFVSRTAFDIEGLGPKIIEQLISNDLIDNASDLFTLKIDDLKPLERFAEKSATNIINSINKAKDVTLAKFIYALGIRHVGEETAFDLANHFGNLENLEKASLSELEKIRDIGGVVAKSIHEYFQNQKNLDFVHNLIKNGIRIQKQKQIAQKLAGKTFVLTGTLEKYSRDEAKKKIRDLGGDVSSSVSSETNYVVAGSEPGSKYDKAKALKIKILNEKEFLDLI
ncbi:MAG: NAD-dependent DNA ligase LigA [Patescibacteria group bacterium]|jgi:DNA ligase (NAD+)